MLVLSLMKPIRSFNSLFYFVIQSSSLFQLILRFFFIHQKNISSSCTRYCKKLKRATNNNNFMKKETASKINSQNNINLCVI